FSGSKPHTIIQPIAYLLQAVTSINHCMERSTSFLFLSYHLLLLSGLAGVVVASSFFLTSRTWSAIFLK
ncbi:MAG: hypothetical protein PHU01_16010, partial [Desulfuromonadaceae bacterium]|nr:hypothetical protein [Desulfuromonadaceae bacterium]